MKWSRRRLITRISAISAFASAVFPEMSVKADAATSVEQPNWAWSKLQLVDAHEITGAEAASLKEELSSSPDVKNYAGSLNFSEAEFKVART